MPLSKNCTEPVGVGRPGGCAATTAVSVNDWPKYAGLADDVSVVVVGIKTTLSLTGDEEDPPWPGSPG